METFKVDENQFDKKSFNNIKLIHKDIYNITVEYLKDAGFEYIFDLAVSTEDINKTYILVINNEQNINNFKSFLIKKGVDEKYIFNEFRNEVFYTMKLNINNEVQSIEPMYVREELSNSFTKEMLSTFLPEITLQFDNAVWVEGDGTASYRFTNQEFVDYVSVIFKTQYDRFMEIYPNLCLDRLYGVIDGEFLKFYYYTAYKEVTDISNGWFTKLVYDSLSDAFVIHEYTGYYNDNKVLNKEIIA